VGFQLRHCGYAFGNAIAPVCLDDFPAIASIQANGGNWIAKSIAAMAKLKTRPCPAMEFESPLFDNMSGDHGIHVFINFKCSHF
jgi:hypothetical protein